MSESSENVVAKLVDRVFPRMPDFYSLMNDQCDLLVVAMEAFVDYMRTGDPKTGKRWLFDATPDIGAIATACALGYLDFRFNGDWRGTHPGLVAWLERFAAAVPAYAETAPE